MSSVNFYVTKRGGYLVPYGEFAGDQFDTLPQGMPILGRFSSIHRSQRSIDQNAKMWACLNDVAHQCVWHGKKYRAEQWKDIFSAALKPQALVQGLDSGLVLIGERTRDMTISQMIDMIELIHAFGAQNGIVFRKQKEPA